MFEIKFVVRDKHLPDILRSVQGIAIEPPVIVPIEEGVRFVKTPSTEAASADGLGFRKRAIAKHAAIASGRRPMAAVVKEWLDNQPKLVRFVPELLIPTLVENGFTKGSVHWAIQTLIKAGRLKKKPGRGNYEVINASTKRKDSK